MVSPDQHSVYVRPAFTLDVEVIVALGTRTFLDSYGSENDPVCIAEYVGNAFSFERIKAELADPRATFFIAELQGEVVGYAKIQSGPAPECVAGDHPIELERIYADQHVIGRGVGSALMAASLDAIADHEGDTVWLGVWGRNEHAIRFYQKWGFRSVGEKTFAVGQDIQTDVVMVRTPAPILRGAG